MESFSTAYDDLAVKGKIMDENMDKVMGDKGTVENVDNMMNQLKTEVAYELTGDVSANDATENMSKETEQQSNTDDNQDFYAQLKNL